MECISITLSAVGAFIKVESNDQVISGWGGNEINRKRAFRDYAFLLVGDPNERPEDVIVPALVSIDALQLKTLSEEWVVSLFRREALFERDEDGFPIVGSHISLRSSPHLFESPYRIAGNCDAKAQARSQGGLMLERMISHSCPVEPGVSGAPLMMNVNGSDHLLAIATDGDHDDFTEALAVFRRLSGATPANEFCSEYRDLCGQGCQVIRN